MCFRFLLCHVYKIESYFLHEWLAEIPAFLGGSSTINLIDVLTKHSRRYSNPNRVVCTSPGYPVCSIKGATLGGMNLIPSSSQPLRWVSARSLSHRPEQFPNTLEGSLTVSYRRCNRPRRSLAVSHVLNIALFAVTDIPDDHQTLQLF